MSNDVVMVAMTKELRDDLDSWFTRMNENWRGMNALDRLVFLNKMLHFQDQLRSAPETMSLEGVERWTQWTDRATKAPDGEWVRFSDLRRLVAPVQPIAVVSREAIEQMFHQWMAMPNADHDEGIRCVVGPKSRDELIDMIERLQLPKPQTVGRVEFDREYLLEQLRTENLIAQRELQEGDGWLSDHASVCHDLMKRIDHLQFPAESEVKP